MSNHEIRQNRPRLGVHLSLGNSAEIALGDARAHGVQCVQVFASSPGAWKPPVLPPARLAEIAQARERAEISPLFIHAIYLINLASNDRSLVSRSRESLIATLRAGELLGASGIVTHIGSHGGRGFDNVADATGEALAEILAATPGSPDLILENSAGAGGIIGSRLDELAALFQRAGTTRRLKLALDTAHLCGAGWDFAGDADSPARLLDEVDRLIGLDRLVLIHANDSKMPPGSRRDRHANIGEGFIGLDGFASLLTVDFLREIPWVLETPDLGEPAESGNRFGSLATLRRLLTEARMDPES